MEESEEVEEHAIETPQETATENPQEDAAENAPEDEAENPPDVAGRNPHGGEEKEPADGQAEIVAATGDDSVTEFPTALQGPEQDDDVPFPETLDVQYVGEGEDAEPRNMEDIVDMDGRPPPMAPPPAIFYREDASDVMDASALGSEFMEEQTFRKEHKRAEIKLPPEKKPEKPQRLPPKARATYPYRARVRTDAQIDAAMRKVPPRHDYCGLIYSSLSQRM
ncbi:unnamed protein product [Candidula unifasciata]|uniref:Uncharacterized protein n=1 Tax=Candidula unifasciata TaxID=100452 RepID=A0A8S4A6Z6_9EUPU|nr:unnamed protein product [Candidula unifasciata]